MKFNSSYFLDILVLLKGVDACNLLETGKVPSNTVGTAVCRICLIRCVGLIKHLITYEMLCNHAG